MYASEANLISPFITSATAQKFIIPSNTKSEKPPRDSPLLEDYEFVDDNLPSEDYRLSQNETTDSPTWGKILQTAKDVVTSDEFIIGASAVVGAAVVVAGAPKVVDAIGFGSKGIKKNSVGASMMRMHRGSTPAGGIVSTCQHVGATGSVLGSLGATAVAAGVGAGVGATAAAIGLAAARNCERNEDFYEEKSVKKIDDWELL